MSEDCHLHAGAICAGPVHEAISESFAVQQLGRVVLDVTYVLADLEGFHLVGWEGTQQVDGRAGWIEFVRAPRGKRVMPR